MAENSSDSQERYVNKSLKKAFAVINLFDREKDKWTITEIANALDVRPGSIYPTLHTLEQEKYLYRDGDKKYQLGIKFMEKGSYVLENMDIRSRARPVLENLRDEVNETVHLGLLKDGEVVYIDKIEPRRALIPMYSSVGKRVPVHAAALGKAILAYQPAEEWKAIVSESGMTQYRQNTITSIEELAQELETVRERGYAIDDAEHEEELRCIAAPVFDHTDSVNTAISLTFPAIRVGCEEIKKTAPTLKNHSREISRKIGWDGED